MTCTFTLAIRQPFSCSRTSAGKHAILNKRFVLGIKLSDTIDYEWTSQPFVTYRRKYSNVGPLFLAKLAAKSVIDDGIAATVRKIVKRALIRFR